MYRFEIFLSLCFYYVQGQVPFLGRCPNIKTVEPFDVKRYMGRWYEAERYFAIFELDGECVTADYGLNNIGSVDILNAQISPITGMRTSIRGVGRIVGRADEGKINVRFPSMIVQFDAPYWVVDTDYENYAVVWSCNDFGVFNTSDGENWTTRFYFHLRLVS